MESVRLDPSNLREPEQSRLTRSSSDDLTRNLFSSTLERLVPDNIETGGVTGVETLKLHVQRYEFAARHVRGTRLLDIACGVGYGTRMLVERLGPEVTVVGVDSSKEAISYARKRYGHERIQFVAADAYDYSDSDGFDTIVSLETIEHLADPARFIAHLVTLLRERGRFIASAPTTPSKDVNPYHLHDFTESSFRRMVESHGFKELGCLRQIQPFGLWGVLARREVRTRELRKNLALYYLSHGAALWRRLQSTVRYGLTNRYLTAAWEAVAESRSRES